MSVPVHVYDGDPIPIITRKNGHRALYNMRPDEIDRMRCDTEFIDGDCVPDPEGELKTFGDADIPRLSEAEIKDIVEWQKATRSGLYHVCKDLGVLCENQNGHGYCWFYGVVAAMVANYAHAMGRYIRLDAHSGAAGYMRGKDRGGLARWALEWIAEHGVVPYGMWPTHSRDFRLWDDPEIAAEAARYRVPESYRLSPGDMSAVDSCLASNLSCGVGLNWWGHLIAYYAVDYSPKYGKLRLMRNSHGERFGRDGWAWLTESPARIGGGSTIIVAEERAA